MSNNLPRCAVNLHIVATARIFDLKKYDDDGRFGYGVGNRIKLTICIDKEAGFHLLESKLSADQEVKDLDDVYEISATVVDSDMLDWWLRGFGDSIHSATKVNLKGEKA